MEIEIAHVEIPTSNCLFQVLGFGILICEPKKTRDGSGRLVQKLLVQARIDHNNGFGEDGI